MNRKAVKGLKDKEIRESGEDKLKDKRCVVVYVHGKGGSSGESKHYKALFEESDVIGFDYHSDNPRDAKEEFKDFQDHLLKDYEDIILIANSIGAFFSLMSFDPAKIKKTFLISPVVDMERLILDMLMWSGKSEKDLKQEVLIQTAFGETLSWEYLCYVREHPVYWKGETHILYGEKDNLTEYSTIKGFADRTGASLTVMEDGEHWFHTEEQMAFLDEWIKKACK